MRITSAGNVGIGTTSPALQSAGTGLHINATANSEIKFTNSTTGTTASDGTALVASGTAFTINNREAGNLTLGTNNSTRVLINSSGNVGIGTTSPGSKLQVNVGTDQNVGINSTGGISRISAYDDAVANSVPLIINGSDLRFTNNTIDAVRITAGNVGIGTTNPSHKLEVSAKGTQLGSSGYYINSSFADTDSNVGVFIAHNDTSNGVGAIAGINELSFVTYGTSWGERMRIDGSGNVGIGTTSPDSKLDVRGADLPPADGNQTLSITNTTGGTQLNMGTAENNYGWIEAREGATLRNLLLNPNGGNVGIGTTTPSYKLAVEGAIAVQGAQNLWLRGGRIGFENAALDNAAYIYNIGATGSSKLNIADSLYVVEAGSVGIGTTNPARILHIEDSSVAAIQLENTSEADSFIDFMNPSRTFRVGYDDSTDLFKVAVTNFNSNALVVNPSGNVGIGTASPSQKLHVVGKGLFTDDIQLTQTSTRIDYGNTTTAGSLRFWSTNAGGEKMRITSAGNVGIGTTNPSTLLDLYSTGAAFPSTTGTSQSAGHRLRLGRTDGAVLDIGSNGGSGLWLQSTNGANLALTYPLLLNPNGGNVGIGTTSPSAKLHVYTQTGNTTMAVGRGAGQSSIKASADADGGYLALDSVSNAVIINHYSSDDIWLVTGGGNVGIGTTNPSQKLQVDGNARVTGAYYDSNNSPGTSGQVLSSTATGTNWVSSSGLSGSGTVGKVAKFTAGTTLGNGLLNDDGTSIWYNGPSPNDTKLAYGKDALSSGGGNYNTAIGFESQESNASGLYNTSLGFRTLKSLTTGNGNIAIGELALQDLTSGNQNICIGYIAGWKITTGTNNTAIGRIALQNNVTGNENTALGVASLRNTTSAFNTGIGSQALTANTTGVGNSALGQLTNSGNFSHSVILGREATATASNQFVVGSSTYNAGTVVTAPQTQTRYWEVVINGVTERILLA
jgi:hypothetical protein